MRWGWWKVCNEELHKFNISPVTERMTKSRRMRWVGQVRFVACVGTLRNTYKISVEESMWKWPLLTSMHRWEDNIKMDVKEMGWEGVVWINLLKASHRPLWTRWSNSVFRKIQGISWPLCVCNTCMRTRYDFSMHSLMEGKLSTSNMATLVLIVYRK
jgi:hypothetical protein